MAIATSYTMHKSNPFHLHTTTTKIDRNPHVTLTLPNYGPHLTKLQ